MSTGLPHAGLTFMLDGAGHSGPQERRLLTFDLTVTIPATARVECVIDPGPSGFINLRLAISCGEGGL